MRKWLALALLSAVLIGCGAPTSEVKQEAPKGSQTSQEAPKPNTEAMEEHLVRVHLPLAAEMPSPEELERFGELEDELGEAVEKASLGELDGNEAGGSEYTIWLYGKDGKALSELVLDHLKRASVPDGTYVFVRYGGVDDPNAKAEKITPMSAGGSGEIEKQ